MSTIIAHLLETLIFHNVYDKVAIGLPIHRASANIVLRKALLSKGACYGVLGVSIPGSWTTNPQNHSQELEMYTRLGGRQ